MRRRRRWVRPLLLPALALAAAFFLLGDGSFLLFKPAGGCPAFPGKDGLVPARCEYVTDGDTAWFRVTEGGVSLTRKVRFLNMDAPESYEEGGREAADHVRAALAGKEVYLEYDSQRLDRYGRQLCHIWLAEDRLFNLELVSRGLARALVLPPNTRYAGCFEAAERTARADKAGIWAELSAPAP